MKKTSGLAIAGFLSPLLCITPRSHPLHSWRQFENPCAAIIISGGKGLKNQLIGKKIFNFFRPSY
jgi:hypothetical protein